MNQLFFKKVLMFASKKYVEVRNMFFHIEVLFIREYEFVNIFPDLY